MKILFIGRNSNHYLNYRHLYTTVHCIVHYSLSSQDAIAANQYFKPVFKLQRGDVQDGFTAAHAVVEGTTRNGGQEHFYLETNVVIAIPKKENGEMELITSSQAVSKSQMFAAKALGVPANRIVARVKRIGAFI